MKSHITSACNLTPQSVTFCAKNAQKSPVCYAVEAGVTKLCEYWGFNFWYRSSHRLSVLSFGIFEVKLAGAFCVECW